MYWQAIYYNYQLFKSQYDACVNRLLLDGDPLPPIPPQSDEIQNREPSDEVKNQVKSRDHYTCLCCGETNRRLLQIDHIAPSYYGGNNSLDNLQTLCRTCNQTKEVNELNFRTHQTPLTAAAKTFEIFKLPLDGRNIDEWKKSLQRCINFFYRCVAVEFIKIGKRGQYFYEWYVMLYAGNNPEWLKPHLSGLVTQINEVRRAEKIQEIKWIRIGAPDYADIIST